jgi:hypothetical protein
MARRLPTLVAVAASTLVVVAGCGGSSSAPELTDPTAIITAALKSSEAATSVHVDAAVDGTAPIAIPGLGGTGAPMTLDGTSAAADLDLAKTAAHATFSVPALFNLAGELIAVDGKGYLKTTIGGAQYDTIDLATLPIDVTNVNGLLDQVGDFLLSGDVPLTKGADVACGGEQCYAVTANLTAEQLAALLDGATAGLPIDLTGSTLDVAVRVEKDAPNHLAGLTVTSTTAAGDALKIDLTFSNWDGSVSVNAPPADQVKGG